MMEVSANHQNHREVTLMINSNERIIKHKLGLLNLAEELGNVSRACKVMGLSRDTFYRYKAAVEQGGIEALFEQAQQLATQWLWIYNNERPHTAIGGIPPRQLLKAA